MRLVSGRLPEFCHGIVRYVRVARAEIDCRIVSEELLCKWVSV